MESRARRWYLLAPAVFEVVVFEPISDVAELEPPALLDLLGHMVSDNLLNHVRHHALWVECWLLLLLLRIHLWLLLRPSVLQLLLLVWRELLVLHRLLKLLVLQRLLLLLILQRLLELLVLQLLLLLLVLQLILLLWVLWLLLLLLDNIKHALRCLVLVVVDVLPLGVVRAVVEVLGRLILERVVLILLV